MNSNYKFNLKRWRLTETDRFSSVFWQRTSRCKVICEETENSEYIMHSLGALDDSCFMAFPMRQDSMWVSSVWCSHCIPARRGGPPTWSQWWSKYCYMATSPSLARRVNCGPTAGLCYLSLPPDHRGRGLRRRGRSQPTPRPPPHPLHPAVNPPLSALPVQARKPANSSPMSLGWVELGRAPCLSSRRQTADAPLEPKAKWGPKGMRCLLTPCHRMTPLVSFPLIQDSRRCIMRGHRMLRLYSLKQLPTLFY